MYVFIRYKTPVCKLTIIDEEIDMNINGWPRGKWLLDY